MFEDKLCNLDDVLNIGGDPLRHPPGCEEEEEGDNSCLLMLEKEW
jgi:hypothetical protein